MAHGLELYPSKLGHSLQKVRTRWGQSRVTAPIINTEQTSIEIYAHFGNEIKMTYDVYSGEKWSYRLFDWNCEKLSYQPFDRLILC